MHYISFQENDNPVSFLRVMTFKSEEAQQVDRSSRHVKEFTGGLYPICTISPRVVEMNSVAPKIRWNA